MLPSPPDDLTPSQRWCLYFVLAGLPGMNVATWFGVQWAMLFELAVWIPQQRIFDALELAKTLQPPEQ